MTHSDPFESFIQNKGLKVTHERQDLYRALLKHKGHFSVEGLVYWLKDQQVRVSRDTVYRNIPLLLEAGIIRQSYRTHKENLYELAEGKTHHDHMLCRVCGGVEEFVESQIEELQEKIAQKRGFLLEFHSHQLVGICKKCRKEKS